MIGSVLSGDGAWLLAATPTVQTASGKAVALLSQVDAAPMLDPPIRAVLLMALLAFIILGLGLIAGAMIGGRWVRRLGGDELTKPMRLRRRSEQASTAGVGSTPVIGPNWNRPGETARLDAAGAETQVV